MRKLEHENTAAAVEPAKTPDSPTLGALIQARPVDFVRALGEPLYLIGSNVQLFSDPHARADLLAVDPEGTAVVVVVEREGEHSLLERGLMSAGLVAGWQPDFFFRYPKSGPPAKLRAFLQIPEEAVNRKQRVVLVAHSHEYAIFSAARWLARRHGIEIWCLQALFEPGTNELELLRLDSQSFRPGKPIETVQLLYPQVSGEASEGVVGGAKNAAANESAAGLADSPARSDLLPLEPTTAPLDGPVTAARRMRTIWQPSGKQAAPRPAGSAPTIEQRAFQIKTEDPQAPAAGRPFLVERPAGTQPSETAPGSAAAPAAQSEPAAAAASSAAPVEQAGSAKASAGSSKPSARPAAEQPAEPVSERAVPLPPSSETAAANQAPPAERRRPFRIVGLMTVIAVITSAGLLILSRPAPPPPVETTGIEPPPPPVPAAPPLFSGTVLNSATGKPIAGARLYYAGQILRADDAGEFEIEAVDEDRRLLIKAPGYRQAESLLGSEIRLSPLKVRGYFVSPAHLADPSRRESLRTLIRRTAANAVVLGVKDVTGRVNVPLDHPLAREIGSASSAASLDLARNVAAWKAEGIYTVALMTVFKDNLLARQKDELALRGLQSHRPVIDADGVAWADPSLPAVRDYNLAVAEAAAAAGFEEIHFDFIRYSSEGYSREGGGRAEYQRRLGALVQFLSAAEKRLAPYNVYLSTAVFGSVCVMPGASVIGQKIEEFAEHVDYVSPMLYPSYFEPGKSFPIPLRQSYKLVYQNLRHAVRRLHGRSLQLRPWLQNFPDRASPSQPLQAINIFDQVKAAEDAHASGWMLWDARGTYRNTAEALARLERERRRGAPPDSEVGGGNVIPGIVSQGGPPSGSAGDHFRMVGALLLTGCCFAVLYGSVRAAWLFRQWTRDRQALLQANPDFGGPDAGAPTLDSPGIAGVSPSAWLPKPAFLRSLHQAGPR